jgi:hypothetical protein
LLTASTTNGAAGTIQTSGVLALATNVWDTVTGQSGGLTTNSLYYLTNVAGTLNVADMQTEGSALVAVGLATSTTELRIAITPPIII